MSDQLPSLNDYTRAYRQPKKIYDVMGFPVKRGLSIAGGVIGMAAGAVVTITVSAVLLVVSGGNPFMIGWGLFTGVAAAIGGYIVMAVRLRGTTTIWQLIIAWIWGTFFQPSRLSGLSRDREATDLHWQVILWQPTDPAWRAARNAALQDARPSAR